MKKKQPEPQYKPADTNKGTTAFPLSDMAPGEELQIYYNDAYMREKQRFNDIFGIIEQDEPEKEKVYIEPSPEEYVSVKQFKKTRRVANLFAVLTVVLAAGVIVLALKLLEIF